MATNSPKTGRARSSTTSSVTSVARTLKNVSEKALEADVPLGMWAATANATAMAPTIVDIRKGSFTPEGWSAQAQQENSIAEQEAQEAQDAQSPTTGKSSIGRRMSATLQRRTSFKPDAEPLHEEDASRGLPNSLAVAPIAEVPTKDERPSALVSEPEKVVNDTTPTQTASLAKQRTMSFPNGYIEPPKVPWTKSTAIGLAAFWKWFLTPFGFLVTLYGLNVVAWGGMLFLLLCGAAPAMCSQNTPENDFNGCNDINSPRRIWLEIDSQILNALFCVTGFGLIPWRARDLYLLLRYRFTNEQKKGRAAKVYGLRKLAGINNGWFRLPGSDTLDAQTTGEYLSSIGRSVSRGSSPTTSVEQPSITADLTGSGLGTKSEGDLVREVSRGASLESGSDDERLPLPLSKTPATPLTGVRAPPTRVWVLDLVIWCNVWNTFLQACLCGFMWGMNRYDRPSWSTGLFIALACIVAGVGGIVMFVEGRKVKRVEGVAPPGMNGAVEAIGTAAAVSVAAAAASHAQIS